MAQRTCIQDGCEKPLQARGLCSTHYNQTYARDRHKKKLVRCVICGTEVFKHSGGGRKLGSVCSTSCRTRAQAIMRGERTDLPVDHWARWYGAASAWPRFPLRDCAYCGARFAPKSEGYSWCSQECRRRHREGSLLDVTRDCRECGRPYVHAQPSRLHCSSACWRRSSRRRGGGGKGAWIKPARRQRIYERDGFICQLCGEPVDLSDDAMRGLWSPSLDHIIPRALGGTDASENLRTAHRWCNSARGVGVDDEALTLAA